MDTVGAVDQTRLTQAQVMQTTAPTCTGTGPFGGTKMPFGLMDYAQILGTPVGKTGALLSGFICDNDHCQRGIILALAMTVGWYGYTRKDVLGYGLMASAAGAVIYTLFDVPKITPTNSGTNA